MREAEERGRHRGLPPGRHPSQVRRRVLPRGHQGGPGGLGHHPHPRVHRARRSPKGPAARRCRWPTTSSCLRDAGLKTLPGTAAEILDDPVRAILCPDKINTEEWLFAHRTAHPVGLRSNVTIMFGAVEQPRSWARHLVRTRDLQKETGGFTEFVPLPFVHMATPIYLQAQGPPGADVPRDAAHARRRPHRLPGGHRQHPGQLGQDGGRRRPPDPAGRRQRPRRHPDGREHLPGRRGQPRPDDGRATSSRPSWPRSGARLAQRTTLYGRVDGPSGHAGRLPPPTESVEPRHDPVRRRLDGPESGGRSDAVDAAAARLLEALAPTLPRRRSQKRLYRSMLARR